MFTMRRSMSRKRREAQNKKAARKNNIILIFALVLVLGGVSTLVWMGVKTADDNSIPSSNPSLAQQATAASDFTLASLDSGNVSLSDYKDQVVVMNFWATWCPPCRAEMPGLNRFYEAHQKDGLTILAINGQENAETIRPFIEANQFTFPVLLDLDGAIAQQYTTRSFPTTFIIDRDGIIQHVQVGEINEQELDALVLPLLQ